MLLTDTEQFWRADDAPAAPPHLDPAQLAPLVEAGLQLMPLTHPARGSHDARGKKPRDPQWQKRIYSTHDVVEWMRTDQGNVGVRLDPDGEFLVIDCDPRNYTQGRDGFLDLCAEHAIDPSAFPRSFTGGGGCHYWLRRPAGFAAQKQLDRFPGVEFRVSGNIVAAGSVHQSGRPYSWDIFGLLDKQGNEIEPAPAVTNAPMAPAALLELIAKREPRQRDRGQTDAFVTEGSRNDHLTSVAGSLRRNGLEEAEIAARLQSVNREMCLPPLDEAEVDRIAASVAQYPAGPLPLTDLGNSERFIKKHGRNLRHCEALRNSTWFQYDECNGLWIKGGPAVARRLAKQTVRDMRAEAACLQGAEKGQLQKHAHASEGRHKIEAMISLASSDLQVEPDEFDRDWHVLLTPSGVLDLSGDSPTVRPPLREDYFSRSTAARCNPGARCEQWEAFLERVLPDAEMREYFRRCAGYSLVGGQPEKCLFVVYGAKDSGKSTAVGALHKVLGTYSDVTRLSTFGVQADQGGNTPGLARLPGLRFVMIPEMPPSKEFGTGLIKQWTGNDPIEAAQKHERPFTFLPAGKLWFVGNHPVRIRYDDDAAWRRLHVLPFNESIPEEEQDPNLAASFDLDGVLAWMVRGYEEYRRRGLDRPEIARQAVAEYREESNPIAAFLEDQTAPGGEVEKGDLYHAYLMHARANQIRLPRSKREFGGVVRALPGVFERKSGSVRYWVGLSLRGPRG